MPKILLVEDEAHLLYFMNLNLTSEGYSVTACSDGQMALDCFFREGPYHLAIVDINIPKINGFQLIQKIRAENDRVGIIVLSARATDEDKLRGLSLGADDYITKPFKLDELLLKVRRMVKRSSYFTTSNSQKIIYEDLILNQDQMTLKVQDKTHQLTHIESSLLAEFIKHPQTTLTRKQILKKVWKYEEGVETRTVDNFVSRLRRLIETDPSHPKRILSIRGQGYRLVAQTP